MYYALYTNQMIKPQTYHDEYSLSRQALKNILFFESVATLRDETLLARTFFEIHSTKVIRHAMVQFQLIFNPQPWTRRHKK